MKTKYRFGTIFLIAFILGSIITYTIGQSGSTFIISEGIYPSSAKITFWREGSTYYGKNHNGLIAYSGTDIQALIIDAIDDGARHLFFKEGNYIADGRINIKYESYSNLTIEGSGKDTIFSTSLNPAWGVDGQIFQIEGTSKNAPISGIYFRNFMINGERPRQNIHPIILIFGNNCTFENLWIYGAEEGIHLQYSDNCIIKNNYIEHTYSAGIELNPDCDGNLVTNNILKNNVLNSTTEASGSIRIWYGASQEYCDDNIFSENQITNGYHGIQIKGGNRTLLRGNNIKDSRSRGIYIYNSPSTITQSNTVSKSTLNGIESTISPRSKTIDNIIIDTTGTGIYDYTHNGSMICRNYILTTTSYGIFATHTTGEGTDFVISQNIFGYIGEGSNYAIRVNDIVKSVISGNILRGKIIRTSGTANYIVFDNNVCNSISNVGANDVIGDNVTGV